jgi:hypothetical protein
MLSNANQNLLHNQGINSSKATQMKDIKTPEKKVKFIPCDEFSQTFSFQRTNKKARYVDLNVSDKFKPDTFKKLK